MHSTLCEAAARCHLRRLRGIVASAPLPAAVMALVIAAAPFLLFRLGGAVGAEVAASIGTNGVASGLVLGPLLGAAVAGATLAFAAPARSTLGNQIAAGPVGAAVAVVALVLVPVVAGAIIVVPSLVAVCIGLAAALPGASLPAGAVPGIALAAATLAAVPIGAVVAEGAFAAGRGQYRRALVVAAGALGWLAIGLTVGAAPLGPLAPVSAALRGAGSPWLALGVAGGVGMGLTAAWVALAATRAAPRSRRPAAGRSQRQRLPLPAAGVVLLGRRADLRLANLGATVFGLAGAALAAATEAPPPAPFLLGTTTALLGSLLCPLVVGGALDDGRWLWHSAPVRSGAIARSFALASTAAAALPVTVVGGVALIASGGRVGTLGVVGTLVVVGSGLALLAGAVLPWRGTGAGDQMTTIAAFAAIAIAASLVVGLVAPRLVALGAPDPAIVVGICVVSIVTGIAALDRRVGAAGR